jgi:hypothetical protein
MEAFTLGGKTHDFRRRAGERGLDATALSA